MNIPHMTVADLIAFLETQPADLLVAYERCSEMCLLEPGSIVQGQGVAPRPDGWVANPRPDKPTQTYLILPGN